MRMLHNKNMPGEGFSLRAFLMFAAVTAAVFVLCVLVGSVAIAPAEAWRVVVGAVTPPSAAPTPPLERGGEDDEAGVPSTLRQAQGGASSGTGRASTGSGTGFFRPLAFLGRHSLLIYMVHQPIVYGVLLLIS